MKGSRQNRSVTLEKGLALRIDNADFKTFYFFLKRATFLRKFRMWRKFLVRGYEKKKKTLFLLNF